MRAALGGFSVFAMDPNGADAYWAGRFGLIPLRAVLALSQ